MFQKGKIFFKEKFTDSVIYLVGYGIFGLCYRLAIFENQEIDLGYSFLIGRGQGKYKTELKTCRREFSEEAVHDFRVAARRLLAFLDLLRMMFQDQGIKKTRRVLKDQLDALDDLRNTQVLLADMSEVIHEMPALQPFQEYLQHKEKKLLRAARKEIRSLKVASLAKQIRKLTQTIEAAKQTDLGTSLFSVVDEAYAVVNQRYALIDLRMRG